MDHLDRAKFEPTRVLIDENETTYDEDGRYPEDGNSIVLLKRRKSTLV